MGQGLAVPVVASALLRRVKLHTGGLGGNPKVAVLVRSDVGAQVLECDLDKVECRNPLQNGGLVNDWSRIPDEDAYLLHINTAQNGIV